MISLTCSIVMIGPSGTSSAIDVDVIRAPASRAKRRWCALKFAVEAGRQAGRDYMGAIIELINHYEQIFDGAAIWPKKGPDETWTRFNTARATWRHFHW